MQNTKVHQAALEETLLKQDGLIFIPTPKALCSVNTGATATATATKLNTEKSTGHAKAAVERVEKLIVANPFCG